MGEIGWPEGLSRLARKEIDVFWESNPTNIKSPIQRMLRGDGNTLAPEGEGIAGGGNGLAEGGGRIAKGGNGLAADGGRFAHGK